LVNDPAETKSIADAAAEVVGEAHVNQNRGLIMGSEDFAYMLEACPGAFINIGIGNTDGPFHSPRYDFNDEALPIGASLFCAIGGDEVAAIFWRMTLVVVAGRAACNPSLAWTKGKEKNVCPNFSSRITE
jgi:hypothetical protein